MTWGTMAGPRTDRPRPGLPWLWVLGALAGHLLILGQPGPAARPHPDDRITPTPRALQTRQITQAAPAPPAPAAATPATRPALPARTQAAVRASRPEISPEPPAAPVALPPPVAEPAPEDLSEAAPDPLPEVLSQAGRSVDLPVESSSTLPEAGGAPATGASAAAAGSAPVAGQDLPPLPFVLPPPASLQYQVRAETRGVANSASGQLEWQHDGLSYRLQLDLRALFVSRQQTSEGVIGHRGLSPRRFGERTRSERAAHFEPEAGRVRFSANTREAPWQPDMQDRLSLFLQLAGRLNASPQDFASGTRVSIPTVSSREAETWVLEVMGRETLELPGGTLEAVRLQRLPRRTHDQTVNLWLAPALNHLPVRLTLEESNGNRVDLQLMRW